MIERWKRNLRKYWNSSQGRNLEIQPDEIFIDAHNLPEFDTERFEGRMENPIGKKQLFSIVVVFGAIILVFTGQLFVLQIREGKAYAEKSENNRLHREVVFAERGLIVDRRGVPLAWNEPSQDKDFPKRAYIPKSGFGHLVGYVSYPKKDSAGFYYQDYFEGKDGAEAVFNTELAGENGLKLTETNAKGEIESESTTHLPKSGERTTLSIDERLQEIFYREIKNLANKVGFTGGAGILMDIDSGELLALTNFPEYSSKTLVEGSPEIINKLTNDEKKPFLNRAISGTYTPGSIVKPFIAMGVLSENIIDPKKQIYSSGKIEIQNPYDDKEKSVFVDWKAHGYVDMRRAIAVSSNVYFYVVSGGFEDQAGLGITNIEKYMRLFGFGNLTGVNLVNEQEGTIPSPAWKEANFPGDPWRLGDTYHTAIGQYGFQVTPIQIVRGVAAIANNGKLLIPTLRAVGKESAEQEISYKELPVSPSYFQIIREGMRQGVLEGTASALNTKEVEIAAKTGTAEIGISKQYVNSWATGFFPYKKPRYAFVLLMEHGPRNNLIGAASAMRTVIDTMALETPDYFD